MEQMDVTPENERKLRELVKIFLEENSRLNLSAHRTPESCWNLNVLDSLALLDSILVLQINEQTSKRTNVIDIGTGGGFPALPLAIMKPEWEITVFDATRKKIEAVQRILARFQVSGFRCQVRCLVGRAEELGHREDIRESFDLVLSRAVAELPTLLELMSPFARVGGKLVCWKSLNIEDELKASSRAQEELRCSYEGSTVYDLGQDGRRQLLMFKKTGRLPEKYPRRAGVPKKKPL